MHKQSKRWIGSAKNQKQYKKKENDPQGGLCACWG